MCIDRIQCRACFCCCCCYLSYFLIFFVIRRFCFFASSFMHSIWYCLLLLSSRVVMFYPLIRCYVIFHRMFLTLVHVFAIVKCDKIHTWRGTFTQLRTWLSLCMAYEKTTEKKLYRNHYICALEWSRNRKRSGVLRWFAAHRRQFVGHTVYWNVADDGMCVRYAQHLQFIWAWRTWVFYVCMSNQSDVCLHWLRTMKRKWKKINKNKSLSTRGKNLHFIR